MCAFIYKHTPDTHICWTNRHVLLKLHKHSLLFIIHIINNEYILFDLFSSISIHACVLPPSVTAVSISVCSIIFTSPWQHNNNIVCVFSIPSSDHQCSPESKEMSRSVRAGAATIMVRTMQVVCCWITHPLLHTSSAVPYRPLPHQSLSFLFDFDLIRSRSSWVWAGSQKDITLITIIIIQIPPSGCRNGGGNRCDVCRKLKLSSNSCFRC